jgi:hypothetical protein
LKDFVCKIGSLSGVEVIIVFECKSLCSNDNGSVFEITVDFVVFEDNPYDVFAE